MVQTTAWYEYYLKSPAGVSSITPSKQKGTGNYRLSLHSADRNPVRNQTSQDT